MPSESPLGSAASVFRVDNFSVPADKLTTFLEQLRRIQRTLWAIPGCHQNLVLTRTAGAGEFNVVTVVEWASAEAMVAAKGVMQKKYADEGFDPPSFMHKLGVRVDVGVYSKT